MSVLITVLLCTRNPRTGTLTRTLNALRAQTLPRDQWELLILDNMSEPPLNASWKPDWHPHARLEYITPAGKAHSIVHGIRHAAGGLLCTVDDDNLLDPDYLEQAVAAFQSDPKLGVAGGRIRGEFDSNLPPGAGSYVGYLAVRDFGNQIRKTGGLMIQPWTPCGAGMVYRREACLNLTTADLQDWGRAEDTGTSLFILNAGYEAAYLPALRLTHVIAPGRLRPEYMELLVKFSTAQFTRHMLRHGFYKKAPAWKNLLKRLLRGYYVPTEAGRFRRRMEQAKINGEREALLADAQGYQKLTRQIEQNIHRMDGRMNGGNTGEPL